MSEKPKPCAEDVRYVDESHRAFDVVAEGRAVGMCVMGLVQDVAEREFPELQDSADDSNNHAPGTAG